MSLVFQNTSIRAGTHAFLIGVGDYPHAKPDKGHEPRLRNVKDLPSAADSALRMADWLLEHRDSLSSPLASLEVLISDTPSSGARYVPEHRDLHRVFDRAESGLIEQAGKLWIERMTADPGGVAFFYGCGHGANDGNEAVLFNSDLNLQRGGDGWAHLKISRMAKALRQQPYIKAALLFLDACGEFVPYLSSEVKDCGFISPGYPGYDDSDKAWLLAAASAGRLAESAEAPADPEANTFDGDDWDEPGVRFGRFTQTLLRGLNGSSSRWDGSAWSVDSNGLWDDLRPLQRIYFPHWDDAKFAPSQLLSLNFRHPIVSHAQPLLPVVVSTDPSHRMTDFDLKIGRSGDGAQPWIDARSARANHPWAAHVPGERNVPFFALAMDGDVCHSNFFKADRPLFDQRVVIS